MDKLIKTLRQKEIVENLNTHFDEANSDEYLRNEIKKLIIDEDFELLFKLKCRPTVLRCLPFDCLIKCLKYMHPVDIYDYARTHNLDKEQMMTLSNIAILMKDPIYIYQLLTLNNAPKDMLVYGLIKTEDLKHLRLLLRTDILSTEMLSMVANEIRRIEDKINTQQITNK